MSRHIFIVDDEARIREVVQYALEREGYRVTAFGDGREAAARVAIEAPDLMVLDVMLPGLSGLDVCRKIRTQQAAAGDTRPPLPILFLSARDDEIDRVVGLEVGADDYLTKPFSPRELVARVRAVLRRTHAPPSGASANNPSALGAAASSHGAAHDEVLQLGKLSLDIARQRVHYAGHEVSLTTTELGLLAALLERPGVVLSRGQLMRRAYRYDNLVTERTIDTHVRRIRAKFRPTHYDPIATVYGVGYRVTDA